jgi:hypothetical protein
MDNKLQKLQEAIDRYLSDYTTVPARQLVSSDFALQDDVASLLVLHHFLRASAEAAAGGAIDKYLRRLVDRASSGAALSDVLSDARAQGEKTAEIRTLYCSYVFNLANWACVSILSASYLAAFIITRTLLEALVSVAAGRTGTMSEKIAALQGLRADEQRIVADCWRELCGWAHPYSGWLRRLCPVLVAKGPLHHPEIARECMVALGITTDLALAIGIDAFGLDRKRVRAMCEERHVEWQRFLLLARRLEGDHGNVV